MTKTNFCTIFDINYSAFGLTLFKSLEKNFSDFDLYVLCWDEKAFEVISSLGISNLIAISREGFYEDIYHSVQERMTYGQMCWLAQPLFCSHLLEKVGLDHTIYIDSDCFFFSSPQPLLDEIKKEKSVSATMVPHNFPTSLQYLESQSGRYCVQFNYFTPSDESKKILDFWLTECLRYDKNDRLSCPGQISLDSWKAISPWAYEIKNKHAGVAVWNIENFDWRAEFDSLIFYHFHGLYFPSKESYDFGNYLIPKIVVEKIYKPYLLQIEESNRFLESRFPQYSFMRIAPEVVISESGILNKLKFYLKLKLRPLKRFILGTYNVHKREKLLERRL